MTIPKHTYGLILALVLVALGWGYHYLNQPSLTPKQQHQIEEIFDSEEYLELQRSSKEKMKTIVAQLEQMDKFEAEVEQKAREKADKEKSAKIDPEAWEALAEDGVVRVIVVYDTGFAQSAPSKMLHPHRQRIRNAKAIIAGRWRLSGNGAEHIGDLSYSSVWILNREKLIQAMNDPKVKRVHADSIEMTPAYFGP